VLSERLSGARRSEKKAMHPGVQGCREADAVGRESRGKRILVSLRGFVGVRMDKRKKKGKRSICGNKYGRSKQGQST